MSSKRAFFLCITIHLGTLFAQDIFDTLQKINYPVTPEPIDVIIPCHKKDADMLVHVINGVKKNVQNVGRIIIVSAEPFTDEAEWFDEKKYPFTLQNMHDAFGNKRHFSSVEPSYLGWYYQQLLKLYAFTVIPNVSSNLLILDADTVFFKPVSFLDEQGNAFYNVGVRHHMPYFEHGNRLIPGFKILLPQHSGVCHFMLMQRSVLKALFEIVENTHQMPFWKAFCKCVSPRDYRFFGASEYELYFTFAFKTTDQVKIKKLEWYNDGQRKKIEEYSDGPYHYVSFHGWNQRI